MRIFIRLKSVCLERAKRVGGESNIPLPIVLNALNVINALQMTPIDCHKCTHYYVTWDESLPHGCRAMGFKSRRFPSALVRTYSDGKDCRLYTARKNLPPSPQKFHRSENIHYKTY